MTKKHLTYNQRVTGSSPEERLLMHLNKKFGTDTFTAQTSDWIIYLELSAQSYQHALKIEKKIKSMKSGLYIQNLKKYPEMRGKLVNLSPN